MKDGSHVPTVDEQHLNFRAYAVDDSYGQLAAQSTLNRVLFFMRSVAPDHDGTEWPIRELDNGGFLFVPPNHADEDEITIHLPNRRLTRTFTSLQVAFIVSLLFSRWAQFQHRYDTRSVATLLQNQQAIQRYLRSFPIRFQSTVRSILNAL